MAADGGVWVLDELWAPIVALTASDGARSGGLVSSTAVAASLLPEAPRVVVQLAKANATHELVVAARAFALHLLPAAPLGRSLELYRELGLRSGGDKLADVAWRRGETAAPILEDALAYAEATVAQSLDCGDTTIVVADVVAGGRREGKPLTIELVRAHQPPEWHAEWERRLAADQTRARIRRSV